MDGWVEEWNEGLGEEEKRANLKKKRREEKRVQSWKINE